MLVFIDESGDAGFKLDSSPNLVMSMVIFDDYKVADETRNCIADLATHLNIKPEFKFANCRQEVRMEFFKAVSKFPFRVRSIIMQKKIIYEHHLRSHPHRFYNFTLKQLLTQSKIQGAQVRIDGNTKKELLKAANSYLRKEIPSGMVKNLKFKDSKGEPLIQLADMITGAIARANPPHSLPEALGFMRQLRGRIENVWLFT